MLGKNLPESYHITWFPAEAECHEVDMQLRTKGHVGEVLFRERGQVHLHSRKIDMPARTHCSLSQHLATDLVSRLRDHLHVNHPVVDEDSVSIGDIVDQTVIVHVDRTGFFTSLAAYRELEDISRLEIQLCRKISGTDRRSLRIHEYPDD